MSDPRRRTLRHRDRAPALRERVIPYPLPLSLRDRELRQRTERQQRRWALWVAAWVVAGSAAQVAWVAWEVLR